MKLIKELFCAFYALILVSLAVVFSGCTQMPEAYTVNRPTSEALALRSTVRILVGTPQFHFRNSYYDYAMACHGVAVAPDKVLTAAHCVDQCFTRDDATICQDGAVFAVSTPEQWWKHTDARVAVTSHAVLRGDLAELTLGESIDAWANVASGSPAFAVFRDAVHYKSTPMRHGDSGSGLFDAGGRLVGIATRAWLEQPRMPEYEEM